MNGTHEGVSGYTISIVFHRLMGDQRTPGLLGVTDETTIGWGLTSYTGIPYIEGRCFLSKELLSADNASDDRRSTTIHRTSEILAMKSVAEPLD